MQKQLIRESLFHSRKFLPLKFWFEHLNGYHYGLFFDNLNKKSLPYTFPELHNYDVTQNFRIIFKAF